MKHCPVCKTNFTDDALSFCTDDGTVLVPGDLPLGDEQATQVFPQPPVTAVISPPQPTDYGLGNMRSSQPQTPEPYRWANETPPAPVWTPPPPPPVYPGVRNQQTQNVAILSLVFGLAAITFGWICGGFFLALAALILGLVALSQIKKNPTKYGGKPLAIGGIVTGGFVFAINFVLIAIWIIALIVGSISK
ncbi:MAG TPA: DUF4190 domain-containing protein [Pyrinomonadaceae bacterium]|nr:DUF4190 domain-containing protein [Pyrinomonadaceae bacterium]